MPWRWRTAGADLIVCHMGLTTGGTIGAETALTLAGCVPLINAWARAALDVNPQSIVLCHGGPIAMPDDAAVHARAVPADPRFLRRVEHGAAADRGRDDRADAQVHGDGEMSHSASGVRSCLLPPGHEQAVDPDFNRGKRQDLTPIQQTEPLSPAQR